MARAIWNGVTVAQSDVFEVVEGNVYFPPQALDRAYVQPSAKTTVCPWKGVAHYYDLVVDGKTNPGAVWYYPDPKPEAAQIKDHVAFWQGVQVQR
jgi:uncharacterized protein (DUF427 family)